MDLQKVKEVILENMAESDFGDFLIDGKFYSPKFGCDTITMILSEIEALAELEKPAEEDVLQLASRWALSSIDSELLAYDIQQYADSYHAKKCAECKGEWKPIDSAPWGKEVLLTGESGYIKPHDRFIINGYRTKGWHQDGWNDATGTPLTDNGWNPTHWKEIKEGE